MLLCSIQSVSWVFTPVMSKPFRTTGVGTFSKKLASIPSRCASSVIRRITLLRTPAFTIFTMLATMLSTG